MMRRSPRPRRDPWAPAREVRAPQKGSVPRHPLIRRSLGATFLGLVLCGVIGASMQAVLEWRDSESYPPPGDLVNVGEGREIHVHRSGQPHAGPTIVLEVGGSLTSSAWAWIQPELAEFADVISYDRAGSGWSDAAGRLAGSNGTVEDLKTSLVASGAPGPYLLVGHSIGGYYIQEFARRYPDDVAGLILLDPTPVGWAAALPEEMVANIESQQASVGLLRVATILGVTRLWNPMAGMAQGLPEPAKSELTAATLRARHQQAIQADTDVFLEVGSMNPTIEKFGSLPVLIVSAGVSADPQYDAWEQAQWRLHEDLLKLSSNSKHLIMPSANHLSLLTDEDDANAVATQVEKLYKELTAP